MEFIRARLISPDSTGSPRTLVKTRPLVTEESLRVKLVGTNANFVNDESEIGVRPVADA